MCASFDTLDRAVCKFQIKLEVSQFAGKLIVNIDLTLKFAQLKTIPRFIKESNSGMIVEGGIPQKEIKKCSECLEMQLLVSPANIYNIFSFIKNIIDLIKFIAQCNSFLRHREIETAKEGKGGKGGPTEL